MNVTIEFYRTRDSDEAHAVVGRESAIAVDLDDCPAIRGVVEALSSPTAAQVVPDTRFMVTKAQLACFRERIEASLATGLDPATVIALDDCE